MEYQHDDLHKEEWTFYFDTNSMVLYLDKYIMWERPTKRSGWKIFQSYNRLPDRNAGMKIEEVPFDEDVRLKALANFIRSVEVKTWEETHR